ncbi:MAG: histidinol-phosphate transaminase [Legionellaceae bacterium]|nr:histidinol-phosphate transaminase [Legionellaceae bacterium]
MPCDFNTLPHSGIRGLHPYVPGKSASTAMHEQKTTDIIKLASNENPLGCSASVLEALASLTPHMLATYTVTKNHPLRGYLAKHVQLDPEALFLSNGSDFIFHMLLECFALHTNKHILTHDYAFISYEVQANTLGIPIKKIALDPTWRVNIDAMIQACSQNTALIFIANPNNPTGLYIKPSEIKRLLDHIPESTLLVLDEAYHEYIPEPERLDASKTLKKYPNLIITRTFSKAYGLAALRLGYALAHPDIIALLYRIQLPFCVSQTALIAGIAALQDQSFIQQTVQLNINGLKQVQTGLDHLGLTYLPSACNFVTFNCGQNAAALDNNLQKRGVLIRPLNPYGLEQHLRVTIGTFEQNTRFLNTLALCLKETPS